MKLYYSPSFAGFVYSDLSNLMFNEKIVDTDGLIAVIKLHAGFNAEKKEDIERTVNYNKAMSIYMKKNPSNIMKDSFEIDGLSVAKECLNWRDTLSFAGWNNSVKAPSKRIEVISGVEEYFTDKSLGDELVFVIDAVKSGCTLPDNLIIETPINYELFSPLEVELIEALKGRGITVEDKKNPLKKTNALSSIKSKMDAMMELLRYVPSDRILLETDAPYLAPVPFRGQKNTPLLIEHSYKFVADARGCSVEELCCTVDSNITKLFNL